VRDFLKTIKITDQAPLKLFQKYCFSLENALSHKDFSKKVTIKQKSNRGYTGYLQDKIKNSQEFLDVTSDFAFYRLAGDLMNIPLDDVKIIYPHFRIDLPNYFKDQQDKMSLPWHQEAAYYIPRGDCTPDSVVISIAMHDCNYENGAIRVGSDTQSNIINHHSFFKDESKNRFYRVECPQPKKFIVAETKFGEAVCFDFKRPHCSGENKSNLVRLTLLIRASSKIELNRYKNKQYS